MKKIVLSLLALIGSVSMLHAQDALAVIQRYNDITGIDKLTTQDELNARMDIDSKLQGMSMKMKVLMKDGEKIRVDMTMDGMDVLMVSDGKDGWVKMAGEPVQELPAEMLAQLQNQINMSSRYKWSSDGFEYSEVEATSSGGQNYQKILMTPKIPIDGVDQMMVYFNESTGLADFITFDVKEGGMNMSVRTDLADYKTFGKYKVPSKFKISMAGMEIMTMTLNNVEYGYVAPDNMFTKPQ